MIFEGTVLVGPEYGPVEGRVVVEDGYITAIEETQARTNDLIVPAFVNAHTHVGDSIAKEVGGGLSLKELVAPPDGLKHRLLDQASREDVVDAIRRSLGFMERTGTAAFLDFRENGVEGVKRLREAANHRAIQALVFARGSVAAMEAGEGFGASGAHDGEFSPQRTAARQADKPFAIHAGEASPSDVNAALDLDPDFLVHMVHTDPLHLERVEERGTPIVVCPRSNLVTNVGLPDIPTLLEITNVALGTDNVFLNAPSMFREMEFTAKCCDVEATDVLRMATRAGAEIANLNCGTIEKGREARLMVLDGESDNLSGAQDIVRAIVRRAGVSDVKSVRLDSPAHTV
jgi:cytosine/adenosine deaminase-related metal-dependent hydrolase